MIDATDRFKRSIVHDHVMKTVVDVHEADGTLLYEDLRITEGNLQIDDVEIRTNATFTVNDPALTPSDTNELLRPGKELRPRRGIVYPDGTEELIELGVLGIASVRIDDSGDGYNLRIDSYDRARKVQRAAMPKDWHTVNNTYVTDEIQRILEYRLPSVKCNFPDIDYLTTRHLLAQGEDPWKYCRQLAAAIGYDLYFDRFGEVVLENVSEDPEDPVWTFEDDVDLSTLIYIFKQYTDEKSYSRVVVTGESSSGNPVRAEAIDDDPFSATYIYGDFGDVPYFYTSSLIKTSAQASQAAYRQLFKTVGFTEVLELLVGPNPILELGDLIAVNRTKSSTVGNYIISKITVPLIYERGMNISGRLRRLL